MEEGYITWINDGKRSWSLRGSGMKGDPQTEISARHVAMEPMVCYVNDRSICYHTQVCNSISSPIWVSLITLPGLNWIN